MTRNTPEEATVNGDRSVTFSNIPIVILDGAASADDNVPTIQLKDESYPDGRDGVMVSVHLGGSVDDDDNNHDGYGNTTGLDMTPPHQHRNSSMIRNVRLWSEMTETQGAVVVAHPVLHENTAAFTAQGTRRQRRRDRRPRTLVVSGHEVGSQEIDQSFREAIPIPNRNARDEQNKDSGKNDAKGFWGLILTFVVLLLIIISSGFFQGTRQRNNGVSPPPQPPSLPANSTNPSSPPSPPSNPNRPPSWWNTWKSNHNVGNNAATVAPTPIPSTAAPTPTPMDRLTSAAPTQAPTMVSSGQAATPVRTEISSATSLRGTESNSNGITLSPSTAPPQIATKAPTRGEAAMTSSPTSAPIG